DGREPTEDDPAVGSGATVLVDRTLTLKARAWAAGLLPGNRTAATYTLKVAPPVFAPGGGLYTAPQQVVLSTATPDADIRYSPDGPEPTPDSPRYTAPLTIERSTTLVAKGFRADWAASDAVFAVYRFNFGTLEPPTFSPSPGKYAAAIEVELDA